MNYTRKNTTSKKRRLAIVVIAIFVMTILFIIADLTFFGKNILVYSKWIECGRAPVEVVELPGSGGGGYREVAVFEFIRFDQPKFFCSATQAEAAGFKHV
jgi:hypothetical protein